jgi:two-component system, cell cycle sensor histidine kinase and response regulator CckA
MKLRTEESKASEGLSLFRPHILVVEDESILALHIRDSLISLGYRVAAVVDSGELALQEAEAKRPDLVLMDIRLKGEMDGIDTAEQIYARFDIPVVYLTAYADESTLQRAKLTAPFGYLVKPFEEAELRPAIEIALNRHALEMKLRQSERWFSSTLKSIGDAVVVTDIRGQVIYMNPVAEGLTRWPASQAIGQDLGQVILLLHPANREILPNVAMTAIQKGLVVTSENKVLVDREGGEKSVDDSAAPIRDESGEIVGAVIIFREISSQNLAERNAKPKSSSEIPSVGVIQAPLQMAAQAAQMASLGIMAAGISHEINQPLHAILVSANSVLYWHKRNQGVLPDTFVKKITDIAEYASRIDQIIRHIHNFWMEPDQEEPEVVNLNNAVRSGVAFMERKIQTHGIKPEIEIGEEVLAVRGNSQRLERVVINLITNAIITLDKRPENHKWVRVQTLREKKQAVLKVQDNGGDVDETILEQVVNPNYSYQSTDGGYGLKLAISKLFVNELKGTIEVASGEPGEATFVVRFPLVNGKLEKLHANSVN